MHDCKFYTGKNVERKKNINNNITKRLARKFVCKCVDIGAAGIDVTWCLVLSKKYFSRLFAFFFSSTSVRQFRCIGVFLHKFYACVLAG